MNPYGYQPYPQSYNYTPPPSPQQLQWHRRPLRRWSNFIGIGLLLVQIIMMGTYMPLGRLFSLPVFADVSRENRDLINQSLEMIAYVLGFWLPTLFIMGRIKIPANIAFPMKRPKLSITIPAVFVCLGVSVVGMLASNLVAVLISYFGYTPIMPNMDAPRGIAANIVYILNMTVAAGVFEELMFRGVILQSLRRFGDGFALVTSSILFGFAHGNLVQGPNTILLGLAIGYFVLRTGSLIPGMVIHAVSNALSVIWGYLYDYLPEAQVPMLDIAVLGGYSILGCVALVFLIVKHGNIFRLAPSTYPLPLSSRYTAFFTTAAQIIFLLLTIVFTCLYMERIY